MTKVHALYMTKFRQALKFKGTLLDQVLVIWKYSTFTEKGYMVILHQEVEITVIYSIDVNGEQDSVSL